MWVSERSRSAEEILSDHLLGSSREKTPPLFIPAEQNHYGEWVSDEAYQRVRSEVLEQHRLSVLRAIEQALKIAKGQTSLARNLMRFRGDEEFVALNALDPDLSRDPALKMLEDRARKSRAVAQLYAALADGLEAKVD